MTQPQQRPNQLTYQQALAAVLAAQAATTTASTLSSTLTSLSTSVITVRETAAAYARTLILGLWRDVDPYDGRQVQAFTVAAARHMVTAQTATSRSAAASQSQLLAQLGVRVPGVPSNPTDVRAPSVSVVGGRLVLARPGSVTVQYGTRADAKIAAADFTTQGMFNRPARTVRAMEAGGADRASANTAAEQRIGTLVDDNVMLAQRFAEAEILHNAVNLDTPKVRIIGYRRVIHPELSRTGVCGLCIAAADQKYKVGTLNPIHGNCKCTIAAVTDEFDPADDVNAADLSALYKQSGGTSGAHLKRVRYQVDEHGELGPSLVPKRQYKPRKKYMRGRRAAATV
jgi:hypothetical protein